MFLDELYAKTDKAGFWVLTDPLIWAEGNFTIIVPKGFRTDLASIPFVFRWLLNQNGGSRRPAVVHDWLYRNHIMSRKEADALFLRALKYEEVNRVGAWLYWAGVRVGGWLPYGKRR